MRKLVLLEHVSLDGYLAGPDGDMSWIRVDDEVWEHVHPIVDAADTAVWGRVTYEMMAAYWPTAADAPDATAHAVHHGRWVNRATRLVFSRTLDAAPWGASGTATVVRADVAEAMPRLKAEPGGDMLIVGSASLARASIAQGLVDELWLNVNPVVLGGGARLFPEGGPTRPLRLIATRPMASGVVGLHYAAG
jgi:dihydrofolate reductase